MTRENGGKKYEKSSAFKFTHVPRANKKPEELLNEIEEQMGARLTENSLSSEQRTAFDSVCAWYDSGSTETLTLGGYAGTGKSTLVSVLAGKYSSADIALCAYTGKASSVIRRKLYEAHVDLGRHEVSTLHSLMYLPIVDKETGSVRGWMRRKNLEHDLIIVDEASMLDETLYSDLCSYGIPVLAVGDHGQLPPVFGKFNLMERPLLKLETIHRQAQNSPILSLSEFARRTGQVPHFDDPTHQVQILELRQLEEVVQTLFAYPKLRHDDVGLLTYTNRERVSLNESARRARWQNEYRIQPMEGDQVICLKNVEGTIFNGMRGIIWELNPKYETVHHWYGKVLFEDDEIMVEGPICKAQFGLQHTIRDFKDYEQITGHRVMSWDAVGLLFDFGYALTVHKSQGSQFEHVIVVHQPPRAMDYDTKKRALYTAVTRCSKYLVVLQ